MSDRELRDQVSRDFSAGINRVSDVPRDQRSEYKRRWDLAQSTADMYRGAQSSTPMSAEETEGLANFFQMTIGQLLKSPFVSPIATFLVALPWLYIAGSEALEGKPWGLWAAKAGFGILCGALVAAPIRGIIRARKISARLGFVLLLVPIVGLAFFLFSAIAFIQ